MSDILFIELCQRVIDCHDELSLIKAAEMVEHHRKKTDPRDFAILQGLVLSKGNELAITSVMSIIDTIQLGNEIMLDVPPKKDMH